MRPLATLLLLLFALPLAAQTPGNCVPGTAQADLDVSAVRARLFNRGNLFFGNSTVSGNGYFIPKFDPRSPMFAANLWVGGVVSGEPRATAATYYNFEMWPGPLEPGALLPDPTDCSAYDRIWIVSALDLQRYEDTGEATPDLAEWPVALGAEVIDGDGVAENYNLAAGDRPRLYGSQTAFWVMNDVGNEHRHMGSAPLGLEVQATAFAIASPIPALREATFYRFTLVNRNTLPIEQAHFGIWADYDLGDPSDDYLGSDSTRGIAFAYNADGNDNGGYNGGYGLSPPAIGFDLLSGVSSTRWPIKQGEPETTGDPNSAAGVFNALRGLWNDGTPITEGGYGYMTDGAATMWAFPGDPATGQFWSEVNADGSGNALAPQDVHNLLSSPVFTLGPGEARTFDAALLFAQGDGNLDSITELRAASDFVQAAYDDGSLFDPAAAGAVLAAPEPVAPEEGTTFIDEYPLLQWTSVPDAVGYTVQIGRSPTFGSTSSFSTTDTEAYPGSLPANEILDVYWRVRAEDGVGGLSPYSTLRSFRFYRFEPDDYGSGIGLIETAYPGAEVCTDSDDPGCAEGYPGNTVWLDPNSTADYVLTNPENSLTDLFRDLFSSTPDDFEIRFTEACATPGVCLGVYASVLPFTPNNLIVSVPFELWNVGQLAEDVPEDDVRMIPLLRPLDGTEPGAEWADTFPAEQDVIARDDTLALPVTQRVIGVMPDRPNGYALFEAAANAFGGAGATYDPENDGDEQVDIYPGTGQPCLSQNFYADFCWRGGGNRLVGPIGGLDGIVFADLAGDGTTPPAGTVIRFDSNEPLFVDAEDDAPTTPQTFALGAAFPNPFTLTTTVPFEIERPGRVRLSVFDVLGRQVATLVDGDVAAGAHRATFNGSQLATGVYFVVLEADGQRQATKVLLVR